MSYQLYASLGTADFYSAHGIDVSSQTKIVHFNYLWAVLDRLKPLIGHLETMEEKMVAPLDTTKT